MKNFLINLVSCINIIYIFLSSNDISIKNSKILLFSFKISRFNKVTLLDTCIKKTRLNINGTNNNFEASESIIQGCSIDIKGKNNSIIIKKNVKLRNTNIIVRGSDCNIYIDENTSFGQARIINVGKANDITIGKDCLFADNIEIWASDTHSIFDNAGNLINPELPIIIGNKVWVGSHVRILKGVIVGDGSVIGMNSIVTKNIIPYSLSVGSPATLIKNDINWKIEYENEK